ncbi:MAG: hypothetical protein ACK4NU_13545, partial [Brevundimonas sp.]
NEQGGGGGEDDQAHGDGCSGEVFRGSGADWGTDIGNDPFSVTVPASACRALYRRTIYVETT